MSEQGYPPDPPAPVQPPADTSQRPVAPPMWSSEGAQPAIPAQPYAEVPSVHGGAVGAPPKRSRKGLWITLAIVIVLGCVIASCAVSVVMLGSDMPTSRFGDAVGVIRMDGIIAGSGDVYSGYITPLAFNDKLQQAIDDPSVKAIVIDVECPGGTVAASEEIAQYVKECPKPVIISIGDVGASGAYMVASQADEIWAMPGSTVGSIGVIAQIPNASELLDKLGVEFNVITAGKYKDAGSPYRPMTDEERALIQGSVNEAYDQFIDLVADGRNIERSKVESLATGWAWSGSEARKLGLIDELGTYEDALDAAADRGGIEGDFDVVTYDDEFPSILNALIGLNSRLGALEAFGRQATGADMTRSLPR